MPRRLRISAVAARQIAGRGSSGSGGRRPRGRWPTRRYWWWAARTTGWCRGPHWTGRPAGTARRRCCSPAWVTTHAGHQLGRAYRRDPGLARQGTGWLAGREPHLGHRPVPVVEQGEQGHQEHEEQRDARVDVAAPAVEQPTGQQYEADVEDDADDEGPQDRLQ